MKIEITRITPNEDWVIVAVNGKEVHAGHEVPDFVWMQLLTQAGARVTTNTVSAHSRGVCSYDCPECDREYDDPFAD